MIIERKITKEMLLPFFTKAAVDVVQKRISIGCELHIDCAEELMETGSEAKDIWGFNIYPDGKLDYISLINVRTAEGNRSMDIGSPDIRMAIEKIMENYLAL